MWRSQLRHTGKFDSRFLNIHALNGDHDAISELDYGTQHRYTGVWNDYQACVESNGAHPSSLSKIGAALFGGCETWRDWMLSTEIGRKEYQNRLRRMVANKDLMRALRTTPNLGFVGMPPPERKEKEEKATPFSSGPRPGVTMGGGLPPGYGSTYARMAGDEVDSTKASKKRRGGDDYGRRKRQRVDSELDGVFRRYLDKQPGDRSRSLLKRKLATVEGVVPANQELATVAWRALANDLVDGQLYASALKIKTKGHVRFPRSAVEEKALALGAWSNGASQEQMMELTAADRHSLQWIPGGAEPEVSLWLDPRLTVWGTVQQAAGALTLSSANATLFRVTPSMLEAALAGGSSAKMQVPGGADLLVSRSKERLARLQHSVNLSFAFAAIKASARHGRELLSASSTPAQADLVGRLRKLVDRSDIERLKEASTSLGVAPVQLALAGAVKASNSLVGYMYEHPDASDAAIVRAYKPVLTFLHDVMKGLPKSLTGDGADGEDSGSSSSSSSSDSDSDSEDDEKGARTSGHAVRRARAERRRALTDGQRNAVAVGVKDALAGVTRALAKMEKTFMQQAAGDQMLQLGFDKLRLDLSVDDFADLFAHYVHDLRMTDTVAKDQLHLLLEVMQLLFSRKPEAVQGADSAALCDALMAAQFELASESEARRSTERLKLDRARLESSVSSGPIPFDQGGEIKSILETYLTNKAAQTTMQAGLFKQWDILERRLEKDGSNQEPARRANRRVYAGKPARYTWSGPGQEYEVHQRLAMLVSTYPNGVGMTDGYVAGLLAKPTYTSADGIEALQAYHLMSKGNLLNDVTQTTIPMRQDLAPLADWGSKSFLPSPEQARAILAQASVATTLHDEQSVLDELLGTISVADCRFHELLLQHNEEPLIGLLFFWPWIRMTGCHAAMVRDGDLGNVMYIEPDCLLSENGQQKLVFFHMSMYFKAIVLNYRAFVRAPFVYCRNILGGYNHMAWDPLNRADRDTVQTNGALAGPQSMFVVPTHIDREVAANHMSLLGAFSSELPILRAEHASTEYEVAEVLCELWGWREATTDTWVDGFDSDKQRRYTAQNEQKFTNVIMSQCHQESWNAVDQRYSKVIANTGYATLSHHLLHSRHTVSPVSSL